MSLAKECGSCPFNKGFDQETGKMLSVCGDPSQRCINLRNRLIPQLAEWERMSRIAEKSRLGRLSFTDLYVGDLLEFICGTPGYGYGKFAGRNLAVEVKCVDTQSLRVSVHSDSLNDSKEPRDKKFALSAGSVIDILGAFERTGTNGETWGGADIEGELHVGRYVRYRPEGENFTVRGLYIQELVLRDAEQYVAMSLFSSDPNTHHQAPPIKDI